MKIKVNNEEIQVKGIVYLITNIKNNKRYVGITTQEKGFYGRYPFTSKYDIERVYHLHKYNKSKNRSYNNYLLKSIEKYGFDSFKVDKVFDYAFSEQELKDKEKYWIKHFDSFKNGYNFTLGGDGIEGFKHDKAFIERHKKAVSGSNNYWARKVICLNTYEIFDTIREASKKYNTSESSITSSCRNNHKSAGELKDGTNLAWSYIEDFNKMSLIEIENKIFLANNNPMHRKEKRVVCLNTKETFPNLLEASNRYGIGKMCISDCCHKKQKSAGKLENGERIVWMYENEYLETSNEDIYKKIYEANNNIHVQEPKKVICITTNEIFNSISEAKRAYGINNISACLRHKIKSAGKHPVTGEKLEWEYVKEVV